MKFIGYNYGLSIKFYLFSYGTKFLKLDNSLCLCKVYICFVYTFKGFDSFKGVRDCSGLKNFSQHTIQLNIKELIGLFSITELVYPYWDMIRLFLMSSPCFHKVPHASYKLSLSVMCVYMGESLCYHTIG